MSPEIRSRRFKGGASQFRKFFLIMKADRHLQLAVFLLLAGGLLIGFSSQFIPPFVSQESYTIQMTNNPHNAGGGISQVEELNIYAESPNYPIYININDSQQQTISYQIYFVNDTNLAVGFGPQKLIESGQFNGPVTLTIPNTVYHMSYLLKLSSPDNSYFLVPVTYSQTVYQYPPANYYLLAPGIIAMLMGVIFIGAGLINIHSDKERYYAHLKLENSEIEYLFRQSRQLGTLPWIGKVVLGPFLAAIGFVLFGNGFLLSWVGIVLILVGIAIMLNGIIQKISARRF